MAFAILVGAGVFEVVKRATDPVLPLPDGEDIVGLTYWDRGRTSGNRELLRLSHVARGTHHAQDRRRWLVERNLAAEGKSLSP